MIGKQEGYLRRRAGKQAEGIFLFRFEPRMPSKKSVLGGGGEDHLGGRHRQVQRLHDRPEHQDRRDDGGNYELPDQQGTGVSNSD